MVCLQEIKCEAAQFPAEVFEELGFQCAVVGQKSYNGVALLSRLGLEPRHLREERLHAGRTHLPDVLRRHLRNRHRDLGAPAG